MIRGLISSVASFIKSINSLIYFFVSECVGGTKTTVPELFTILLSVLLNESMFLDVALIYAIISFVAVMVLTQIYIGIYREKKQRLQEIEIAVLVDEIKRLKAEKKVRIAGQKKLQADRVMRRAAQRKLQAEKKDNSKE